MAEENEAPTVPSGPDTGSTTSYYDDLPEQARTFIDEVRVLFSGLFDRDEGEYGPFLDEVVGYSNDTMAVLFNEAFGLLATQTAVPKVFNWGVSGFPYKNVGWRYGLTVAMVIAIITHLMRSYVEIPDTSKVGASDVQRRDYLQRWQTLLKEYQDRLKNVAKGLEAEMVDDQWAEGNYSSVLIDFPSAMSLWQPWAAQSEKPIPWSWW